MVQHKWPFVLCFATCVAIQAAAQDPSASTKNANRAATISVKSFGPKNVIGHLGQPLGTIVRVSGVVIDGDSTRRRVNLGKTLLEVQTVDGEKLQRPMQFEYSRARKEIPKPLPGQRFDYYVHEYGAFDGVVDIPEELEIEEVPVANDGFHYRPYVTVHKSVSAVD